MSDVCCLQLLLWSAASCAALSMRCGARLSPVYRLPPPNPQVRRKNLAVAAARKGNLYVLGCSARSDQFDKEKEAAFETIVQSFRLLAG